MEKYLDNREGEIVFRIIPDTLKHKILTVCEMNDIINRERSRSNRNRKPFSLIMFEISIENQDEKNNDFLNLLIQRIRCTDEIGLLSLSCIGVIMPETSETGALTFIQSILCSDIRVHMNFNASYATYPSRKWEENILFQ